MLIKVSISSEADAKRSSVSQTDPGDIATSAEEVLSL